MTSILLLLLISKCLLKKELFWELLRGSRLRRKKGGEKAQLFHTRIVRSKARHKRVKRTSCSCVAKIVVGLHLNHQTCIETCLLRVLRYIAYFTRHQTISQARTIKPKGKNNKEAFVKTLLTMPYSIFCFFRQSNLRASPQRVKLVRKKRIFIGRDILILLQINNRPPQ